VKVLVVAAWEPELARFRGRLAATPVDGVEVVLETVGVGVVEASVGMTRRVARHEPDVALLLGTAGALPRADALGIGQVVVASSVRLVDAGILDGRAELPQGAKSV